MAAAKSTVKNAFLHAPSPVVLQLSPEGSFRQEGPQGHVSHDPVHQGHSSRTAMVVQPGQPQQRYAIYQPTPSATVTTDASLEGWGGHVKVEGVTEISMFSDLWTYQEL